MLTLSKKHLLRINLLMTVLLCCHFTTQGQDTNTHYFVRRYTDDDGMATTDCMRRFTDSRGFNWICSFQGLSLFDGRRFITYSRVNGLSGNAVQDISEDTAGYIYVATTNGLDRFTGQSPDAFFHYKQAHERILGICPVDTAHVYVLYGGTNDLYITGLHEERKIKDIEGTIADIAENKRGFVYALTTSNKLYTLHDDHAVLSCTIPGSVTNNTGLYKDEKGNVWTTGDSCRYYYKLGLHGITDSMKALPGTSYFSFYMAEGICYYLIGSDVLRWDGRNRDTLMSNIPFANGIYRISTDEAKHIWMCTTQGLYCFTPRQSVTGRFITPEHYFSRGPANTSSLFTDTALLKRPMALKWFQQLKKDLISVYAAPGGAVWYCATSGLYLLQPGKSKPDIYNSQKEQNSFNRTRFYYTLEDGKGGVWFSSCNGVDYYKNGHYTNYHTAEGLSLNCISSMAIDKAGIFYASGKGVYAFDGQRFHNISTALGIGKDFVPKLAPDLAGNLWICNSNRLIMAEKNAAGQYIVADSLMLTLNNKELDAESMDFDGAGNLWLLAGGDMYIFLRNAAGHYTTDNRFSFRATDIKEGNVDICSDHKRYIYIVYGQGISDKVLQFDASAIIASHRRTAPVIALTGMLLNRMPCNWAAKKYKTDPMGMPVSPVLTARDNSISLLFTAAIADMPEDVVYRYRLDDYDTGWQPVTKEQRADYINIPPGSYTFRVQARGMSGIWGMPVSCSFVILPPWYFSWWGYCLWVLAISGILFGAFYFIKRAIYRNAQKEQMITEQQLKTLRAQINPHFLQNTFEFLAHQVYHAQPSAAVQLMYKLSAYLRNVLDRSDEPVLLLEDELEAEREYLEVQKMVLPYPFSYEITVDENADITGVSVPSMLLQPVIENALKYGTAAENRVNLVQVKVWDDADYIYCSVTDSGSARGGKTKSGHVSKGIFLTIERLKVMYRKYKLGPGIETVQQPSGGWIVTIKIPVY